MRARTVLLSLLLTAIFVGVNLFVGLSFGPRQKTPETAIQAWWKEEQQRLSSIDK